MIRQFVAGLRARRTGAVRAATVTGLVASLAALWLVPAGAAPGTADPAASSSTTAQQQVLEWTADDSMTEYASAPATAEAGPATIVFENSQATGNTTGMSHTLTFETGSSEYNSDVDVNLLASPFDANGGRHEIEVNLTPGTYLYLCTIPGHGEMRGELVVTEGGGGDDDTTPPEVTAEVTGDQNEDGSYVGAATVGITATDDSGIDTVEYNLDGEGYQPYTDPLTVDQPGDHTVEYRATDNAGNTSDAGSTTFTVVEGDPNDTTPPEVTAEVTGDQNEDGDYVASASVEIAATDSGSGIDTVEYNLDGEGYQPYTDPLTVDQPGDHTVEYRATDNAGNTSDAGSTTFTVVEGETEDTTPPEVTAQVTGPQNAQWDYVDQATVSLSANDTDSGVRFFRYSLDGGSYTPYGEPIEVNGPGEHTVLFHAIDHAGNRSEDGTVTFTVVAAEGDACVESDIRDTAVVAGHDSTVANVDTGNGCTINDVLAGHSKRGHGNTLATVTEVADRLAAEDVISQPEKRRLVKAAEHAAR
ncbi:OmpL47-type beta-barrel domain-containing protein [Saccharomonospora piscinae]|uniref:OmpL47-type beta-barrel domain-containing protein n=1 Tax=Saccharomonospora piscinae TaxID=687388 RepID=UPI0004630670|nr:plastocyanin/azurin family copper-binding protein [Saccharomonospora piscinae]